MPVKPARGARARVVTSLSNFNWARAMKLARGARDSVLISCRFSEVLRLPLLLFFTGMWKHKPSESHQQMFRSRPRS